MGLRAARVGLVLALTSGSTIEDVQNGCDEEQKRSDGGGDHPVREEVRGFSQSLVSMILARAISATPVAVTTTSFASPIAHTIRTLELAPHREEG